MDKHRKALELAGHAGCILLKNGAEIFRVQETMIRILCAYGVTDHNVYVISNGIFATEGEGTDHALSLVRHVPLGGVNLSRIDAVNAVSREICAGKWSMDEAEAALTRVETLTPERPITHIFACALGAAMEQEQTLWLRIAAEDGNRVNQTHPLFSDIRCVS